MAISRKAQKFLEGNIQRGRPIPGQSLTKPIEQQNKWDSPPEFVEPKKAMYEIFTALTEKDATANLLLSISNGVGVIDLASIVLYAGYIEGKWNHHLMALLMEPTMYMIMALAERADIDYILESGDTEDKEMSPDQQIETLDNSLAAMKKSVVGKVSDAAVPREIKKMVEEVEIPQGLLDRVQQEKSLLDRGEDNE